MQMPTDCGCLHDCECCGSVNVGDLAGDGTDCCKDLVTCGPCADGLGMENPCDVLCENCGPVKDVCNGLAGTCGDLASGCGDVLGDGSVL